MTGAGPIDPGSIEFEFRLGRMNRTKTMTIARNTASATPTLTPMIKFVELLEGGVGVATAPKSDAGMVMFGSVMFGNVTGMVILGSVIVVIALDSDIRIVMLGRGVIVVEGAGLAQGRNPFGQQLIGQPLLMKHDGSLLP